jgi:AcrR family transcriptional regulator
METRKTKIVSMTEKEKIIRQALKQFLRNGFLKTRVDEIASELRISKKTIYRHFESKEELILAVIDFFTGWLRGQVTGIVNSDDNAVIKLQKIGTVFLAAALHVSDQWISDLNSSEPKYWAYIEEIRKTIILENFNKIIIQGKKEGLIIDEPTVLILTILTSSLRAIINPAFLVNNNFSVNTAGQKTLFILINGILSKKGRKIFKQYKPEFENEIKSIFTNSPSPISFL